MYIRGGKARGSTSNFFNESHLTCLSGNLSMAGKRNLPFSLLPYGSHLTVLTVSCLVAVAFSHPVKDHNTRPLHLDDIGAYFRIIVEEIEFVQSNLSLELTQNENDTVFGDLVCPLFGIYSRMQQALIGLSEDDLNYHNVSVFAFVFERQAESLCERVKASCGEGQLCANMNCNVSSIALSCLQLSPPAGQVNGLWGEDQHQDRVNRYMIPLWLGEILSNGYPDVNTSSTLESILLKNFVNCTIPYDGSEELIECTEVNFLG